MITLSATLTSAMKLRNKERIWKVVLSRTSQVTKGYDKSRVTSCPATFEPSSHKADITLRNGDEALTSLNFEHYEAVISHGYDTGVSRSDWAVNTAYSIDDIRIPTSANGFQYRCAIAGTSHASVEPTWPTSLGVRVVDGGVTWEMDGNSGDEYARRAPLRVRVQELISGRGVSKVILRAIGQANQLKEDTAVAEYTQTDADVNTVKTLISAVCAAGNGLGGAYNGYPAITVVFDSDDSLIDSFKPADYFSISVGDSRWDKIDELLAYTKCKWRFGNDGKLHIFVPTITGSTYDYEYKWQVSGDHDFYSKTIRLRFIDPNKIIAKTQESFVIQYTGNATSSTSFGLAPKVKTVFGRFVSNAQCTSVAEAMIERAELDAERGFVSVPMNVGQELWDYVKVTDSKAGDSKEGNIQYIGETVKLPEGRDRFIFDSALSFGKVTTQSIMANLLLSGDTAPDAGYNVEQLNKILNTIEKNQGILDENLTKLFEHINSHHDFFYSKVGEFTEGLTIPVVD